MTNAANFFAAFEACLPAAYEVSCRIRTGSPTSFWLDSPRTVASRRSIGSPVPRRRGLGRQAATRRRQGKCMSSRLEVNWCLGSGGSGVGETPTLHGVRSTDQGFERSMIRFASLMIGFEPSIPPAETPACLASPPGRGFRGSRSCRGVAVAVVSGWCQAFVLSMNRCE
jgi:hypothetical protein